MENNNSATLPEAVNKSILAAVDLLFFFKDCTGKTADINRRISNMHCGDDFYPRVAAAPFGLDAKIIECLDTIFLSLCGLKDIAAHTMYETGIVYIDDIKFNTLKKDGLINLLEYALKSEKE